jgi:aminopeptidase N
MGGFLRVKLDEPLLPGEQLVVTLEFVTNVPDEESTKYKVLAFDDDILALAHFYPMFAVYDETGWHTMPSPPHGDETFADASFYLVEVKAPTDQVLVAAGNEVDRHTTGEQQSVTFAAGPARDFYLVSSDRFEVTRQQLGPVLISSYAPGDSLEGAELALSVAADALESFEARYGPYPYSELDIVSTPTNALGVEYPGVFANALRIYDLTGSSSSGVPNSALLESTTAHETAHQWFYNLIGNDQLNEPWLDESLTQYATWQYFIDSYGEPGEQGFYRSLEERWARAERPDTLIGLPTAAYSGQDYGPIVYGRGPIFLNELAEIMGQETFDEFLNAYSNNFRWGIATGADFRNLAEQYCECDLSGIFDDQVFGPW